MDTVSTQLSAGKAFHFPHLLQLTTDTFFWNWPMSQLTITNRFIKIWKQLSHMCYTFHTLKPLQKFPWICQISEDTFKEHQNNLTWAFENSWKVLSSPLQATWWTIEGFHNRKYKFPRKYHSKIFFSETKVAAILQIWQKKTVYNKNAAAMHKPVLTEY